MTDNTSPTRNDVILSWTVHLARQHPCKLVCSLGLVALAACAGFWVIGLLGSLAVITVMTASLADFLFPVRFELTPDGAACKMLFKSAQINWSCVRRCYLDDSGVKLSPLAGVSRLEAFRGVYLRFNGNQQQVISAVKTLRGDQC